MSKKKTRGSLESNDRDLQKTRTADGETDKERSDTDALVKALSKALSESEEKYRKLFDSVPVGIGISDSEGRLIDFNDAVLVPGGYRREDIARIKSISELYFTPEDRTRVLSIARKQGFLDNAEVRFKSKHGSPYEAMLSLRPISVDGKDCWQAMPGGGDLYLQTENAHLSGYQTKPYGLEPGRYVKISVSDTGFGIEEEVLERIFDPFFTTKEMGRGTGLGLASVYGIIKNHRGIINVFSKKGEGTSFNLYLPASDKKVRRERHKMEGLTKGSETVLLVDDEEMVIEVGTLMLENLGYRVMAARGGDEAASLYRENKDAIHMVILDMIMPGIGGAETYEKLKKIDEHVKVLLSSGYSMDDQAMEILDRGCNGFMQKPFNMKKLSQKIREILEK